MATKKKTIPWKRIRDEYVTTKASYRFLAAKYHVGRNQISDRAGEEHWQDLRSQFKATQKSAIEGAAEQAARMSAEIGLEALDKIAQVAMDAIPVIAAHIETAKNGNQLESSMSALRIAESVLRSVYGLETAGEKAKRLLDERKLALEERKASRGEENAGGGLVIRIDSGEDYAG